MVIPKIKRSAIARGAIASQAFRMRLSTKFILLISMLIVLTSVVLSVFFVRHEVIQIRTSLENRGKSLARNLAYNSEYGVLIGVKDTLDKPIGGVVKEEDVVYAIIQDEDGTILALVEAAQPIEIPEETRKTIEKEALKAEETLVKSYKVKKESFYDIASPIITIQQKERSREEIGVFSDVVEEEGIEKIGVARIGISMAHMNEQMGRVRKIITLLTLAVVSVGILGTILFVRRLVKPIKLLVLATERIAGGDLEQAIKIQSADEIGDLANSFNRMAVNLKQRSEELQQSYALLDEKNKELESFVYTVSHDLKAPLVSLEGFASMLLGDKYKESIDETGQLYLLRIQANVENMGNLIQDLLELSRIGRIVPDYGSVDIAEIIQETIETLQVQLSERGTELVVQEDLPTITCDRIRIEQVFENLISNANKFMGEKNDNPKIEIGFENRDNFFEFFVKDNGIGIQKEYQEKVFEIFERLGDVEAEGTGVGLAKSLRLMMERFG